MSDPARRVPGSRADRSDCVCGGLAHDMRLSTEDFFLYLTVALIILIPLVVRVYRYVNARQVKRMLRDQFGTQADDAHKENSKSR